MFKRVGLAVAVIVGVVVLVGAGLAYFYSRQATDDPQEQYRIGVLQGADFFARSIDGFKEGMTSLGYIEGEDISYDVQRAEVDPASYRAVAEQFVADDVDLILSFPTDASIHAKQVAAPAGIPVIFTIGDTNGNDLVDSIREPGGNITGVHYPDVGDLSLLRLEIMKRLLPDADQIVLVHQPSYPIVPGQVQVLVEAGPFLELEVIPVPVTDATTIEAELAAWEAANDTSGIDGVLMIDGPVAVTPPMYQAVGAFAERLDIPIGGMPQTVQEYPPLFSVLIDIVEAGRQASILADKVLRGGIAAGTIPLPSAETYIQIYHNTAEARGIEIPQGLLERANEIIR
jgi:putative ABC transport system substrate-binding protein